MWEEDRVAVRRFLPPLLQIKSWPNRVSPSLLLMYRPDPDPEGAGIDLVPVALGTSKHHPSPPLGELL